MPDETKYPETLEEARAYEESRIPQKPGKPTLPKEQQWLHDIFLVRKLTKAPLLYSTQINCVLVTDRMTRLNLDNENDKRRAHWLTEIANHEAEYVKAFCWEFPENYEFPPELGLSL